MKCQSVQCVSKITINNLPHKTYPLYPIACPCDGLRNFRLRISLESPVMQLPVGTSLLIHKLLMTKERQAIKKKNVLYEGRSITSACKNLN